MSICDRMEPTSSQKKCAEDCVKVFKKSSTSSVYLNCLAFCQSGTIYHQHQSVSSIMGSQGKPLVTTNLHAYTHQEKDKK